MVRAEAPAVLLDASSNEAARLGGTTQTIVSETWWNDHGQVLRTIDPEGNVTTLEYYPERDPDGDLVASISPWRVVTNDPSGYLAAVTVDATVSPRRTAAAAPAELTTRFRYDPVGNLIRVTNPRGVTSELEVNALNEVVVSTRGAEVAEAAAAGQLLTGTAWATAAT